MSHPTAASHEHSHPGPRTYLSVLIALLILTVITVSASRINFGAANTVIALVIASIKASLVALYFMHLRQDKFNAIIFVGGLFFLGVLLIFTLFDVDTRETILPGSLKAPIEAFPGAPLNKPIQPSTGTAIPEDGSAPVPPSTPTAPGAPSVPTAPGAAPAAAPAAPAAAPPKT
jgi:cytochrome c oxidase subunit IV